MTVATTARRGSALIITFIVTTLLAFMLVSAGEMMSARKSEIDLSLAEQQARYAAEAIAAIREDTLQRIAASNNLAQLERNPMTGDTSPWRGVNFFGNCVVEWRVEPVFVANQDGYAFNPPSNVAAPNPGEHDFDDGVGEREPRLNQAFYNFRIASRAFYLDDPESYDEAAPMPWTNDPNRLEASVSVQSTRVVQLRISSLFLYALFYGAEGPDGDIEFHNGPAMDIGGSVYSNGSIFFGGDGGTWNGTSNGAVRIGTAANQARVTAVDGLYSIQKMHMQRAFLNNVVNTLDPFLVPTNHVINSPTNDTYRINNIAMRAPNNDSRSTAAMQNDFDGLVTDRRLGAQVLRTIENVGELGGRSLEWQARAGRNLRLYYRDPARGDWTLTILPGQDIATQFPFYVDPIGTNYRMSATGDLSDPTDRNRRVSNVASQIYYTIPLPQNPGDPIRQYNDNDVTHALELLTTGGNDANASQVYADAQLLDPLLTADWSELSLATRMAYLLDSMRSGVPVDLPSGGSALELFPASAEGMPLFYQRLGPMPMNPRDIDGTGTVRADSPGIRDVTDPQENDPAMRFRARIRRFHFDASGNLLATPDDAIYDYDPADPARREARLFPANAVPGTYLEKGLFGGDNRDPGVGLVIRERPIMHGARNANQPDPGLSGGATWFDDYVDYMLANYIVFYGTSEVAGTTYLNDVSEPFFRFSLSAAPLSSDDVVAFDHWVRYRRELGSLNYIFNLNQATNNAAGVQRSNNSTSQTRADGEIMSINLDRFRSHWFTINMDHSLAFMRSLNPDHADYDPNWTGHALPELWNGMVYAHRTRRLAMVSDAEFADGSDLQAGPLDPNVAHPQGYVYHPILRPGWLHDRNPQGRDQMNREQRMLDEGWSLTEYQRNDNRNMQSWGPADIWFPHSFDDTTPEGALAMSRWRDLGGPDIVFGNTAVRLERGQSIVTGLTSSDEFSGYWRAKGVTVITPNPLFVKGHYNTQTFADSNGQQQIPPCAVFTDHMSVLSRNWRDNHPDDATFANMRGRNPPQAETTTYNVSVVTNNMPSSIWRQGNERLLSGGPHNLIRYNENWGGRTYRIMGSVVVMGPCYYTRGNPGWNQNRFNSGIQAFNPPTRDITFNTDLLTRPGQPPFTPFAVNVVRTAQNIRVNRH